MQDNISEERLAGCALGGTLSVTAFIRDAITIVHAPQGCAHQTFSTFHATMADAGLSRIPPVLVSNITNREVIFGGEEALTEAIDRAESQNPALIVVVTSCIPETIGDDVAGVCASHPEAEKIVYIPSSGFLGGSAQAGENAALIHLSEIAMRHPRETVPRTAALIGEKNLESEVEENFAEVKRLLARLGISIIVRFCRNIDAKDIEQLSAASCFIIRDERVAEAGKAIAQKMGKPVVEEFPAGLAGSIRFLREAGTAAGIPEEEIEAAVRAEEAHQEAELAKFSELCGMRIALGFEPFEGCHAVAREAMARLGITESLDGVPANLPFYLPVGLSGVLKMVYLWRREKRK